MCVLFSLLLISTYLLISCVISSLTHWLFSIVLFNFYFFGISQICLLLISNFIPAWSKNIVCMILVLLNLLKLVSWPNVWGLSWGMFHVHLRICVLLLHRVFCRCLQGLVGLCSVIQAFCVFVDVLCTCSIHY